MPQNPEMDLKRLKPKLDELCRQFDLGHISPDPIELVHPYEDPADQEVAAFIAAALAYGQVQSILRSARRILEPLGASPRTAVCSLTPRRAMDLCRDFRHRFTSAADMARFLMMIRRVIERHGSLQSLFLKGYNDQDPHIGPALERFVSRVLALDQPHADRLGRGQGAISHLSFLLPLPSKRSACKRLNLFLRWMVRPADGVDLGLWPTVSPSKLLIPLDTHVWRIARSLGLSRRGSPDWRAAVELTQKLKQLDPADPVRYDFAISRLGILGRCTGRDEGRRQCESCVLSPVCRAQAGRRPAPHAR